MCGIFGVASKKIDEVKVQEANNLLEHRGPDSSGTYIDRSLGVFIGFSRLSIQDLSEAGNQPLQTSDGRIILTFNGEIYNFKDLRVLLVQQGYEFKSESDSEVILAGYVLWGIDQLLKVIDGMFAVVIFDKVLNKIVVFRDHFGIKPLYYYLDQESFIFSSEIKPIVSYLGNQELNLSNLVNSILFTGMPRSNGTNFKRILRVMPGQVVFYDLLIGQLVTQRYFELRELIDEDEYRANRDLSRKQLSLKIGKRLSESLRTAAVSDANLGVLFSGGLDSSLITKSYDELTGNPSQCFTLLNEDSSNPTKMFRKKYKNPIAYTEVGSSATLENLGTLIHALEDINKAESWALGKVCKNARERGFKSLLTGDGADELFGGYNEHANYYLNRRVFNSKITSKVYRIFETLGLDSWVNLFASTKPANSELLTLPIDLLLHNGKGYYAYCKSNEYYSFEKDPAIRAANALLYDEVDYWIERFMLRADRFSMSNSIELRLPFVRKDVVRLALNIPFNKKIKFRLAWKSKRFYETKTLLRGLAKTLGIPHLIHSQRKIGTQFTSSSEIEKLFSNWDFSELVDCFGWDLSMVQAKGDKNRIPDRLKVSLVCGDIFIRLFQKGVTKEEIDSDLVSIMRAP
jgi:asparagine synthase (glutamine-hydrolysing)